MKRICVLFISGFLLMQGVYSQVNDTTRSYRDLSIGIELSGPVIYSADSNNLNLELRLGYRINQKYYAVAEPGISRFSYSQYNYDYRSSGVFIRMGIDINLLKSKVRPGNHFAGLGLRYGVSVFNQETPVATVSNYWGDYSFIREKKLVHAHFLEVSGGVKAELFKNVIIGWTIRGRLLVYQSAGKTNKPINIPGMGTTGSGLQPGFSYHLIYVIPLKEKK